MAALAAALPGQQAMGSRPYATMPPQVGSAPNPYPTASQVPYSAQQRPYYADPVTMARLQQQQLIGAQYGGASAMPRQQGYPVQQHMPFSPLDPYGFGTNPAQYGAIDPRYATQQPFMMPQGMPTDICTFTCSISHERPEC